MKPLSLLVCLFISLAAFAGLEGCAPRPLTPVERPKVLSQEEWLTALRDRTNTWQSYQAQLHIRAQSPKGKFNLRAVILASLPDRYRLEAFNPFGQTVALLVLNRQHQSTLFIPSEKVLYTAAKAETLVAHFLGIPLPLDTFGYSLVGCVPPEHLDGLTLAPRGNQWLGASKDTAGGLSYAWRFLPQPPTLKSIEVREGSWNYKIVYEPEVALTPRSTPGKIKFQSPQWQMETTLDQIQSTANTPDSAFNPELGEGIRRVNLDKGS